MFGPPGHAYVYFTYGMHWCLNVVTGSEGEASAVLLRAGEVVDGLVVARRRRPAARADRDLARGPARLAAALGVSGALDGTDLCRPGPLRLWEGEGVPLAEISVGPRVGISREAGRPWRWWRAGNATVSSHRRAGG